MNPVQGHLPWRDVADVKPLPGYRLWLRFADGVEGVVDLSDLFEDPEPGTVFEPYRDPAAFAMVSVNPEIGAVSWPNGADLDSSELYQEVKTAGAAR